MGENNVDGQTFEGSAGGGGGGGNVSGSGVASQVAFWSGTNTIVGSGNFLYTGDALLLNPLEVVGKGLVIGSGNATGNAQFVNFTSGTPNDQVIFGNQGFPGGGFSAPFSSIWNSDTSSTGADIQSISWFGGNFKSNQFQTLDAQVYIDTVTLTGLGNAVEATNLYIGAAPTFGTTSNLSLHVVGDTLEGAHLLFTPSASNFSSGVFGIASTLLGNEIHSSDVTNGIYITGDSSGSNVQLLNIKLESFGSPRSTISLPSNSNGLFFNTPITDSGNHDYQFLFNGASYLKIEGVGNGGSGISAASTTIGANGLNGVFSMIGHGGQNMFSFDAGTGHSCIGNGTPASQNIFSGVYGTTPTYTAGSAFEFIYNAIFPAISTPATGSDATNLYGQYIAGLAVTSNGDTIGNVASLYIAGVPVITGSPAPTGSIWAAYIDGNLGDNSLFIAGNTRIDDGTFTHQWSPTAASGTHTSNSFTLITSGTPSGYILESNVLTILNTISTNTFFYGINNVLSIDTTAAMSGRITAFNSSIDASGSTGTLSSVKAFNSFGITGGSGSITNAYHFYAANGSGIGTQYGFLIENLTGGTNNYGIKILGASTRALWVAAGTSEFNDRTFVTYTTVANGDTAFASTLNSTTATGSFTYNGSNAVVNVVGSTDTSSTFNGLSVFANGTSLSASLTGGGNITGINSLTIGNAAAGKTLAQLSGVNSIIQTTGTGNITSVINYASAVLNTASGTTAKVIGFDVINATNSGGGTITNQYGITIGNLTSGASNYGLYIAGASTNAIWVNAGSTRLDGIVFAQHFVGNKIYSGYALPGVTAGTGAASGTPSITGSDAAGVVSVTTGVAPSAGGTVVTVTFNVAYGVAPAIQLTPANAATALLSGVTMVYATGGTTTFVITAGSTALTGLTAYSWNYQVIG